MGIAAEQPRMEVKRPDLSLLGDPSLGFTFVPKVRHSSDTLCVCFVKFGGTWMHVPGQGGLFFLLLAKPEAPPEAASSLSAPCLSLVRSPPPYCLSSQS